MEVREIKALIALMREHGLVELEIEDKKGKVRLVRGSRDAEGHGNTAGALAGKAGGSARGRDGQARAVPSATPSAGRPEPELAANQILVRSPMVGTFYRAASPGAEPFVEEGTPVRKGQPLCIIEAMKMMNEVEAETGGTVVKILCDNGQPVEYGQPLMILRIG